MSYPTILVDRDNKNVRHIGASHQFQIQTQDVSTSASLSSGLSQSNFTTVMTMTADSNVGIGTTVPLARMHIMATGTNPAFRVGTSSPFVISSLNYIGVGTTNPLSNMHIYDNANTGSGLIIQNSNVDTDGHTVLRFRNSHLNDFIIFRNGINRTLDGGVNTATIRNEAGDVRIHAKSGVGLHIKETSGNIGIGTQTPLAKVHVIQTGSDDAFRVDDESGDTTPFIINASGNVGIGTTNPLQALQVAGNISLSGQVVTNTSDGLRIHQTNYGTIFRNDNADFYILQTANGAPTGAWNNYRPFKLNFSTGTVTIANTITAIENGNVGIGVASPVQKLHVVGSAYVSSQILGNTADSVSAPSYSWSGDTNTGMYHADTDAIGFTTNGSEKMRIISDGNVGVGRATPRSKLEISGTGTTELTLSSASGFGPAQLTFISDRTTTNEWRPGYIISADNGGGTFTGRLDFYTNGTTPANKFGSVHGMSVTNAKVGIATTNPLETLHVTGSSYVTSQYLANDADTNALPGYTWRGDNDTGMFHASNDTLAFSTGGTERMRISSDGNVGIGTATSQNSLHVFNTRNGEVGIILQNTSNELNANTTLQLINDSGNSLALFVNSTKRTEDGGALTATLRNNNGDLRLQGSGGSNNDKGLRVKGTSGSVGIGTGAPNALLDVNGNMAVFNRTGSGGIYFEGGTTYDGTSGNSGWHAINFNGYHDGTEKQINTDKNRWRIVVDQRTGKGDSFAIDNTSNNTYAERLRITTTGNVGIGTSNPSTLLDVNGVITAKSVNVTSSNGFTVNGEEFNGVFKKSTKEGIVWADDISIGIGTDKFENTSNLYVKGIAYFDEDVISGFGFQGPGYKLTNMIASQIPQITASGFTNGLTLWYDFQKETASETTTRELFNREHNGTLSDATVGGLSDLRGYDPDIDQDNNLFKFSRQLHLKSTSSHIKFNIEGGYPATNGNDVFVGFWYYMTTSPSINSTVTFVSSTNTSTYSHLVMKRTSVDKCTFAARLDTTLNNFVTKTFNEKEWYHIGLQSLNNTKLYLYINGERVGDIVSEAINTNKIKYIGNKSDTGTECAQGWYGNVVLYERAVSEPEIEQLYLMDRRSQHYTRSVGIGTTNPQGLLHIYQNSETNAMRVDGVMTASKIYGDGSGLTFWNKRYSAETMFKDTSSWVSRTITIPGTPATRNWRGIAWAPELNRAVIVAENATTESVSRVAYSSDLITWTMADGASTNVSWTSVCWSPEKRLFVAVGISPQLQFPPAAMTANTMSITNVPYGVGTYTASSSTFNTISELQKFNAFGAFNRTGGSVETNQVWMSASSTYNASTGEHVTTANTNGYKGEWLQLQLPQSVVLQKFSIQARNDNVRGDPKNFRIFGSSDGTTWTQLFDKVNETFANDEVKTYEVTNITSYTYYRLAINQINVTGGGTFVAIGEWILYCSGVVNNVMTSTDGITWNLRASANNARHWREVIWESSLNLFVAMEGPNTYATNRATMTSPDGITWTMSASSPNIDVQDMIWNDEHKMLVACGSYYGTYKFAYSKNATDWTEVTDIPSTLPASLYDEYPPSPLTGTTTTVTGKSYGNGIYEVSASSRTNVTYNEVRAFDKVTNGGTTNVWISLSSRYTVTNNVGVANDTTLTPFVSGSTTENYKGEHITIKLPNPIVLTQYNIHTRNHPTRGDPRDFAVFGSTDGTTWIRIDNKTNENIGGQDKNKTYTVTSSTGYNWFRLAINKTNTTDLTVTFVSVGEWKLYGFSNLIAENGYHGIAWSPKLKLYVAVSAFCGITNVRGSIISTSTNATKWDTVDSSPFYALTTDPSLTDVVWCDELEVFLAVGWGGIWGYSFDGKTWTARSGGMSSTLKAIWVKEFGVFAAPLNNSATVVTTKPVFPTPNSTIMTHPSHLQIAYDTGRMTMGGDLEISQNKNMYLKGANWNGGVRFLSTQSGATNTGTNDSLFYIARGGTDSTKDHLVIHSDSSSPSANNPGVHFMTNDATSRAFLQSRTGNFGIGTTSPSQKLHVEGSAYVSTQYLANSGDSKTLPAYSWSGDTTTGIFHPSASAIAFSIADTEEIRITSTGLGVNTTSPTQQLHVVGKALVTDQYLGKSSSDTKDAPAYSWDGDTTTGIFRPSTNIIAFTTGANERMRIASDGNVGIGVASPVSKLHVAGYITGTTNLQEIQRVYVYRSTTTLNIAGIGDWGAFFTVDTTGLPSGVSGRIIINYSSGTGADSFYNNKTNRRYATLVGGGTIIVPDINTDDTDDNRKIKKPAGATGTVVITSVYWEPSGLTFENKGNIGINTYSPQAKLHILHTGTGDIVRVEDETSSDTTPFVINESGSIGIGTATPSQKLHVGGNTYVDGSIGIGTTAPSQKLHVQGNVLVYSGTNNPSIKIDDGVGSGELGVAAAANNWANGAVAGDFVIRSSETKKLHLANGGGNAALSISSGNIGIGTTSPTQKLHVVGNTYVDGSIGIGIATPSQKLHVVGNTYINGRVGVGSASPDRNLNVHGSSATEVCMAIQNTSNSTTSFSILRLINNNSANQLVFFLNSSERTEDGGKNTATLRNDAGDLRIQASNVNAPASGIIIKSVTGNVGIGSSQPTEMLDVGGNVKANTFKGTLDGTANQVKNTLTISGPYFTTETSYNGLRDVTLSLNASSNHSISTSNTLVARNSHGNIAVGNIAVGDSTTAPTGGLVRTYDLRVHGDIYKGNETTPIKSSQWTDGTDLIYYGNTGTGNIGIGTSNPREKLEVFGKFLVNSQNDVNAKIGIGTTNPLAKLHLYQTSQDGEFVRFGFGTDSPVQMTAGLLSGSRGYIGTFSDHSFALRAGDTDRVYVTTTGNVGIGTATPRQKLHVEGSIYATTQYLGLSGDSQSAPSFTWNGDTDTGMFRAGANSIAFTTNGTRKVTILSDGKVGIGSASPDRNLNVHGSSATEVCMAIQNTSNSTTSFSILRLINNNSANQLVFFLNSSERTEDGGKNTATLRNDAGDLRIQASNVNAPESGIIVKSVTGNVGIGTTSPTQKLHVEGRVKATSFEGDGSALTNLSGVTGWIRSDSIVYTTSNVGINTSSPLTPLHVDGVLSVLNRNGSGGIFMEGGTTYDNITGNSGWHAINFNGYYSNVEVVRNTEKYRWRMLVDQRNSGTDQYDRLVIDTFNKVGSSNASGSSVLSVNARPEYELIDRASVTSGTLNTTLYGTIKFSAESTQNTADAWKAFDNYNNTFWLSTTQDYTNTDFNITGFPANSNVGRYLQVEFGVNVIPTRITLFNRSTDVAGAPDRWTVYGSQNGTSFTELSDTVEGTIVGIERTAYITKNRNMPVKFIRIYINSLVDSTVVKVCSVRIFGYRSGDAFVGIGTNAPYSQFEVSGTGTQLAISSYANGFGAAQLSFLSDRGKTTEWRPAYVVSADNGTYTGRLDFFTNGTGESNKFGATRAMSIANGNVGIGTNVTSPTNTLEVGGAATINGEMTITKNENAGTYLTISNTSNTDGAHSILSLKTRRDNSGTLSSCYIFKNNYLRTAEGGANAFTIRNEHGDIQLKCNSGNIKLENDTTINGNLIAGGNAPLLILNRPDPNESANMAIAHFGGAYARNASQGDLVIRQNTVGYRVHIVVGPGDAVLTVTDSKVGIGKTNPGMALDVEGSASLHWIEIRNSYRTDGDHTHFNHTDVNTFVIYKKSETNRKYFFFNVQTGVFTAEGDVTVSSDKRYKTDIQPIYDALNKLRKLTGYTYIKTNDPLKRRHCGLIAQEVQEVLCEAVYSNSDGFLNLSYGSMLSLVIQAVKELESNHANEITDAKHKITTLQARIADLEAQNAKYAQDLADIKRALGLQ